MKRKLADYGQIADAGSIAKLNALFQSHKNARKALQRNIHWMPSLRFVPRNSAAQWVTRGTCSSYASLWRNSWFTLCCFGETAEVGQIVAGVVAYRGVSSDSVDCFE